MVIFSVNFAFFVLQPSSVTKGILVSVVASFKSAAFQIVASRHCEPERGNARWHLHMYETCIFTPNKEMFMRQR